MVCTGFSDTTTQTSLVLEQAPFAERNIRFLNANTFYLDMSSTLAKDELK